MFDYIVQPGDTIYRIADKFDVGVRDILLANPGLNPDDIYPGLVIKIPISNYLYQRYPWYIYDPYLFIGRPRIYWDDRRRWPIGWPGGPRPGPRPPGPRPPGPGPGPRPPGPRPPGPGPRPPRPGGGGFPGSLGGGRPGGGFGGFGRGGPRR